METRLPELRVSRVVILTARIGLVMMVLVAALGAMDPDHDSKRLAIAPDEVEHAALSYCMTLLLIASLPRTAPILLAGGVIALGSALEVVQYFHLLKGDFEITDWAANIVGTICAYLPFTLGARRRF